MAISVPARRRWPIAVTAAIGGLVVGLATGLALSGGDDSDPIDAAREARSTAVRAATVLEVVPIEYGQAASGGAGGREGRQGAAGAVARSRGLYLEVRPVIAVVDPVGARTIDAAYRRLATAVDGGAPAGDVRRQSDRLRSLLVPR